MKIIRLKSNLTVILDNGTTLTNNNCDDEMYNYIMACQDNEEEVKAVMAPELYKRKEEIETKTKMLSEMNGSEYLTVKGKSVYIESVSQLTVPEDLATALYNAEQEGDKELVQTYINFWTLASLNPDSRARTNLFWFLNKYGMKISSSGLFVAYRNVELKSEGSDISSDLAAFISDEYSRIKFKNKKAPKDYTIYTTESDRDNYRTCKHIQVSKIEDKLLKELDEFIEIGNLEKLYKKLGTDDSTPVYTDYHSRSFKIKIGEPVSMPREKCDAVQENTCSRGLHVAGKSWLRENYFGSRSLIVLVNPADVVAVPPEDNYGKMRTCAYYPIGIVKRDDEGEIIDENIEDGFEDDFLGIISFEGEINNEDLSSYSISIPSIPELDRENILERLDKMKQEIANRYAD